MVTISVTSAVKRISSSSQVCTCGTLICTVTTRSEVVGAAVIPAIAARIMLGTKMVCVDVCTVE
jgi:hypothetical protein